VRRPPGAPGAQEPFNSWTGSIRAARTAGNTPNAQAVSNANASENTSNRPSTWPAVGGKGNCRMAATPNPAITSPAVPPHAPSTRLSVSCCRATRHAPAPSASARTEAEAGPEPAVDPTHDPGPRPKERRASQDPPDKPATRKSAVRAWPKAIGTSGEKEALVSPHERPIRTPEELLASEIRCDRREPDECIRAADAYELGRVVEKNEDRADRHRKVGLTHYVNQCHSQDPSACFALARMYREGDIVKSDATQADALLDHVTRLCVYKQADVCQALEVESP
jgi:hypothetical protein